MKALVIGATGATGKDLVNVLLQDAAYTQVVIFVRRPSGISHPNLKEILTDFNNLEQVSDQIRGDVWFCCLGTTLKAAGSKDNQRRIDYEIPLAFAKTARKNGIGKVVLLSAYGASSASRIFYSQLKGKLEDDITALDFDQNIIFRPGLLLRKDTDRAGERISASILNFFNTIGIARRFRPLSTSVLAEKMAKAPKTLGEGKHVVELSDIFNF